MPRDVLLPELGKGVLAMESQPTAMIRPAGPEPNDVPSIEQLNDSWFHWRRSHAQGSPPATPKPARAAVAPLGDELADAWFR
jgi:hypothetical protein